MRSMHDFSSEVFLCKLVDCVLSSLMFWIDVAVGVAPTESVSGRRRESSDLLHKSSQVCAAFSKQESSSNKSDIACSLESPE